MNPLLKILLSTSLVITFSSVAQDVSTQESQWIRDNDNYYSYYALSSDEYQINAQMRLIDRNKKNKELVKLVDFRLVWSNKEFCEKYKKIQGVITKSTYYVNNQAILFNITCFKDEYVNVTPENTDKGKKHLFKIFDKARGKNVLFVKRLEDGKDIVYKLPSLGFSKFFSEANKATKSSI